LTTAPLLPFAIQRDVSRHTGLIAKKITKRAKNHDGAVLRNIAKAFSGLSVASSPSEKKKHNHDIGLMVSNRTTDMGFELALTPNGERIEVTSVREGSAAAELGVTVGDKVKDVGGWTKQKALKKGITGLMKYIETAPRPLRIVIRHKGFVTAEDSTSETSNSKSKSKGDGKNKKSK
jgi:predicted metalloprotease with PDZ domain